MISSSNWHTQTVNVFRLFLLYIFIMLFSSACSTSKGPVLYPNEQVKEVSDEQVDQDIKECVALAESSGAKSNSSKEETKETAKDATEGAITGAATGAVTGNAGVSAATGAIRRGLNRFFAGLDQSNEPSPAFKRIVERCLIDKGYEPIGWE